jgi:hypothetical protein
MKLEVFRHVFDKSSNIKFRAGPSNESRFVPCGHADITKLVDSAQNFVNVSKIKMGQITCYTWYVCMSDYERKDNVYSECRAQINFIAPQTGTCCCYFLWLWDCSKSRTLIGSAWGQSTELIVLLIEGRHLTFRRLMSTIADVPHR